MVTAADMEAMAWIREHTTPGANFLVNGFIAFGGTSVVGADGGWWIPLLTGRESTVPPLLYGMEATRDPDYREQVRSDFLYLQQFSPDAPEWKEFLNSKHITHVYAGQGGGMVGNPGQPLLDPAGLARDPDYRLVYHRNDVWILELTSETP
jgi:hypothetical protein